MRTLLTFMVVTDSFKVRQTTSADFSVERMREAMGIEQRLEARLERSPEQFAQASTGVLWTVECEGIQQVLPQNVKLHFILAICFR